jgi:hypothetical protein
LFEFSRDGIAEQVSSPTGCIMLVQTNHACDSECGHPRQVSSVH